MLINFKALTFGSTIFDAKRATYLSEAETHLQILFHEKEDLKQRLAGVIHLDGQQEILSTLRLFII